MKKKLKEKNTRLILFTLVLALALIILTTLASAEFWACFKKAEKIDFCNPKTKDRTCGNNNCMYCMKSYDETNKCHNQGNFNVCNSITPECSGIGNNGGGPNTSIDSEPPVMTIHKPVQDNIYKERLIPLDIVLNERGEIEYYDNINGKGKWTKLCKACMSYNKKRGFNEGLNNIKFRAKDVVGNNLEQDMIFHIDSKDPKITKVNPKQGFASGKFEVMFKEDNPKSLTLHYGNEVNGMLAHNLDIESACTKNKDKYNCLAMADISSYDSQKISYWFELKDIAGNSVSNKPVMLNVDTTPPLINTLNYSIHENRLMLSIGITEEHFNALEYMDSADSKLNWKKMCTILKGNMCVKKISLKSGNHAIAIKATDKAGNSVTRDFNITI